MNLTALQNITPYQVNNSLINNTNEIASNLISNANTQTNGYFGLIIMLIVFVIILISIMSEQDVFRLDFISALIFASLCSLIIGVVMIVSNLITSYQHVIWFAIIFISGLIAKYYQKQ